MSLDRANYESKDRKRLHSKTPKNSELLQREFQIDLKALEADSAVSKIRENGARRLLRL